MQGLAGVLKALNAANCQVIVIGGTALQLQGSAYLTNDVDFVYERTRSNCEAIASALRPFHPRPRDFPEDLPFVFDAQTLLSNEILTLDSDGGNLDFLAKVKGIGDYAAVKELSETMRIQGLVVRVLSVDGLILAKRAAGRPKDEPGLVELEALKDARWIAHDRLPTEPDDE